MPSGSASPSPPEEPPDLGARLLLPPLAAAPPRPLPGLLLQYHAQPPLSPSPPLLPASPQPPLLPDTGLLRERLAGLGLRRRERGDEAAREPEEEDEEEEEEEGEEEAAPEEGERGGGGGDLELDLEEPPEDEEDEAAEEEEEEEEEEEDGFLEPLGGGVCGPASLLLLPPPASSPPLLPPGLGSVLLPPQVSALPLAAGSAFEVAEAGALGGALYGPGDDVHAGVMAAMLSQSYGPPGAAAAAAVAGMPPGSVLNGEQAALLRRKSVNTTECVPVPSSEHVAEIVGRQGELRRAWASGSIGLWEGILPPGIILKGVIKDERVEEKGWQDSPKKKVHFRSCKGLVFIVF
uniref:Uncharacterized protein n=1 Tax=Naja naja TaxID=35670 RepID=A0A8C6XVW7_NAJNA